MKKIEVVYLKPQEIKLNFGNPRKITESNKEKLQKSLEQFGDHDVIKINEEHQCISGNQRIQAMIKLNIETPILCKKLIGYTESELKKINIDSNEHSGEWNYDLKDEWENGFDFKIGSEEKIKEIKITPYNKIHFLISIDVDKIQLYDKIIQSLQNKEGVEIEQSQN